MDASVSAKPNASTFETDVRGIVTAKYVRTAGAIDAVAGARPSLVVEPGNEQELAKVLKLANAAGLAVVPRGGGTKLEWGNRPTNADVILSTVRMHRVIEHAWADLTVSVEAGCTIAKLQETVAKHKQRLALDALWPEQATVGGVLSTNDSGALRLRFGSLRDLVIGATVALADGTVASSGGKVVKNVAGYDLPKLVTGAFGTLGVVTRAIFRLHPLPRAAKTFSFTAESFPAMQQHILAIQDSQLAHTALQIRCAAGELPAADILFEATDAGLAAQESQLRKLLGSVRAQQSSGNIWNARQHLWNRPTHNTLLAKISLLPTDIAKTLDSLKAICDSRKVNWQLALQATGIGMLRLEADPSRLSEAVKAFRTALQSGRGPPV